MAQRNIMQYAQAALGTRITVGGRHDCAATGFDAQPPWPHDDDSQKLSVDDVSRQMFTHFSSSLGKRGPQCAIGRNSQTGTPRLFSLLCVVHP